MTYDGRLIADARYLPIADESVQCCLTSPPYWGLRKYNTPYPELGIGNEPTIEEYIEHIVQVFREVKRTLKRDGVIWVNMGDCYGFGGLKKDSAFTINDLGWDNDNSVRRGLSGVKPKDLVGMPWLVAFALRKDGWYLRQEIIWHKTQAMPESVRDRPTRAHEQIFLLSKSARYFYNADAIKEPASENTHARYGRGRSEEHKYAYGGPGQQTIARTFEHMKQDGYGQRHEGFNERYFGEWESWNGSSFHDGKNAEVHPNVGKNRPLSQKQDAAGDEVRGAASARFGRGAGWRERERLPGVTPKSTDRGSGVKANEDFHYNCSKEIVEMVNKRSVWSLGTAPYPEAHYATFPPDLVEPCILAGSRPGDVVLDPFFGSGTVGMVAERFGRRWIGIDLGYQELQRKRLQNVQKFLELGYRSDDEDDHTGDDEQPDCYENHLAE